MTQTCCFLCLQVRLFVLLIIYFTFRLQLAASVAETIGLRWFYRHQASLRGDTLCIVKANEKTELLCCDSAALCCFQSRRRSSETSNSAVLKQLDQKRSTETLHRQMHRSKRTIITIMVTIHPSLCSLLLWRFCATNPVNRVTGGVQCLISSLQLLSEASKTSLKLLGGGKVSRLSAHLQSDHVPAASANS